MANLTKVYIDSVLMGNEHPIEFVRDSSEEFNFGTFKIVNSTQKEPYPDYADVEIELNSVNTFEAVIQRDFVTRTAIGIYQHEITLAEPVIKLSQYPMADRSYSTIDGATITYEDQLDNILETQEMGKTSPFTIHADTQTLLDTDAIEKEYLGGNLLITITDMFRSVNAVPTLSLANVIGHRLFGELGDLVSFSYPIGESITSDISDYGLAVQSKVKNATYEGDNTVDGGTYYPSNGEGVTPRSTKAKWDDDDAEWFLDSGIRRIPQVKIKNLDSQSVGTVTNAQVGDWFVSKAEWDELTIERTRNTMITGKHKNNTLYYTEGDYVIRNAGVQYENNGSTPLKDTALEGLIRSYWYSVYASDAQYDSQSIRDIELEFYYQPMRDMDVRVERHNIDRVVKNATLTNNQKDSKLELQRYGKALKSQINRVGNDSYEVTLRYKESTPFTFHDLDDYDSDGYKIVKIQYIARKLSIDVIYKLVKNASILDPNTSVDRSVSPFTVTKKNVNTCFMDNNYLEFSSVSRTDDGALTANGKKAVLNGLKWNATYDTPIYNAQFVSASSGSILLNMSAMGVALGTSLLFHAQFLEPKIAGYQLVADTYLGKRLKPIAYTDEYGQVETATIDFYTSLPSVPNDLPIGTSPSNPLIDYPASRFGLNPNEIFGFSKHIHCISNMSNLIVGDYFAKNNSLVKLLSIEQIFTVSRYPATIKHTIYDTYRKAGSTGAGTLSLDAAYKEITMGSISTGESWVVHKSAAPYDVYLAFNYEGADLNTIYVNSLEDRPDIETL